MKKKVLLIARNTKTHSIKRISEELEKESQPFKIIKWKNISFFKGSLFANDEIIKCKDFKSVFFQSPIYYISKKEGKIESITLPQELFLIAKKFVRSGAFFINSRVILENPFYDKLTQSIIFEENNIPSIKTLHLSDNHLALVKNSLKKAKIPFPVVIKESFGGVGDDVYRAANEKTIENIIETRRNHNIIYQNFIPNNCDFRVIVCKGKSLGIMKRSAVSGMWKNNYSLGANIENYNDKKMEAFAEKICKKIGFDYAGVDLLMTPDGYEVIEINLIPNFKGFEKINPETNIAREIVKILT